MLDVRPDTPRPDPGTLLTDAPSTDLAVAIADRYLPAGAHRIVEATVYEHTAADPSPSAASWLFGPPGDELKRIISGLNFTPVPSLRALQDDLAIARRATASPRRWKNWWLALGLAGLLGAALGLQLDQPLGGVVVAFSGPALSFGLVSWARASAQEMVLRWWGESLGEGLDDERRPKRAGR